MVIKHDPRGPKDADEMCQKSWWWLEPWNFMTFPSYWESSSQHIPTDFQSIIFQRGRYTTNQTYIWWLGDSLWKNGFIAWSNHPLLGGLFGGEQGMMEKWRVSDDQGQKWMTWFFFHGPCTPMRKRWESTVLNAFSTVWWLDASFLLVKHLVFLHHVYSRTSNCYTSLLVNSQIYNPFIQIFHLCIYIYAY